MSRLLVPAFAGMTTACAGMTKTLDAGYPTLPTEPPNYPGIRPHNISTPNNHPFMIFMRFMVNAFVFRRIHV